MAEKMLSAHFSVAEFACHDAAHTVHAIDPKLIAGAEKLRSIVGEPIHVDSGYRTVAYNAKQPGASPHSQHLLGKAMDVVIAGKTPAQVYEIARKLNVFTGFGLYDTFIHLDVRTPAKPGQIAFWDYRTKK
jgi:uncharacterized protein YcbK (DUF882 family)